MTDFDPELGQFTDDPDLAPYIDRRSGTFYGMGMDGTVLARFPGRPVPLDDWHVFIPMDADIDKAKRQWDEMERRHRADRV